MSIHEKIEPIKSTEVNPKTEARVKEEDEKEQEQAPAFKTEVKVNEEEEMDQKLAALNKYERERSTSIGRVSVGS